MNCAQWEGTLKEKCNCILDAFRGLQAHIDSVETVLEESPDAAPSLTAATLAEMDRMNEEIGVIMT